jgi:hypothetical protein
MIKTETGERRNQAMTSTDMFNELEAVAFFYQLSPGAGSVGLPTVAGERNLSASVLRVWGRLEKTEGTAWTWLSCNTFKETALRS